MLVSTTFLRVLMAALAVTGSHGFSCWDYANGCNVPSYMAYRNLFTPACITHDVCYRCGARYGIGRRRCDDVFRNHMAGLCVGQPSNCNSVAYSYFTGVRAGGWAYYHNTSPSDCRDSRVRSQCLSRF